MKPDISSATEMSALDLNNIKLDAKHTVLTPEYLENLIQNGNTEADDNNQATA